MASTRQSGQAMILALALLGIGALITIPALTLTDISLRRGQLAEESARDFYAADAGQEYAMWKLKDADFLSLFKDDGDSQKLEVDICGSVVEVEVIMKATTEWRGVTLIKDNPVMPTKTVSGPVGGVYTYTITLEQISDNTSGGLDAVYDILPTFTSRNGSYGSPYYDYQPGSSRFSADGGKTWSVIDDPAVVKSGSKTRTQWPATYDYSTGKGGFTSPMRDFTFAQIKKLEFKIKPSNTSKNTTYYNWVALKPWDTVSGSAAPLVIGSGKNLKDGFLSVQKQVSQTLVPSGQPTIITYTLTITNLGGSTNKITSISDYLPQGFTYIGNPTGLPPPNKYTVSDSLQVVNGVERHVVEWQFNPAWSISATKPNNFVQFTFQALVDETSSGSYYNEIVVIPTKQAGSLFSDIGIDDEAFSSGYLWNSAPVLVPFYDVRATAGRVTVNANLSIVPSGLRIESYRVR